MSTAAPYVGWYEGPRSDEYETPPEIFDPLHAEFGFTIDAAARAHNTRLPRFMADGLTDPWAGERVWCNPPFSKTAKFIARAPEADLAVFLVPARVNSRWWHQALRDGAVPRYPPKRPRFHFGGVPAPGNCPVDCAILVFGGVVS